MDKKTVIKLKNVDIYQRENLVLSKVDIEIKQGEFIYIIGKVGTGKSSLIKTLNAELPIISGTGQILDFNLGNIRSKETSLLRRKLGVVFQDFKLLQDRDVYENLAFILKATGWKQNKAINDRVKEVLEAVGMIEKKKKMPHELSGGEQQRIVIARAMLNNADIILADEPTGNLDPETSEQILDIFIRLNNEGKTILMATHDYAVIAKKPTRYFVCADGKLTDSKEYKEEIEFNHLLD